MTGVTAAARRMCREVNDEAVIPGCIYRVDLATGQVGALEGAHAAKQIGPGDQWYGTHALFRISYARTTASTCQRFLDAKGEGW